jgi:thiol-disulfide isomerase/thioredoxin
MSNQKILVYVFLVVVVLGGGMFLFSRNGDKKEMMAGPTPVMENSGEASPVLEKTPVKDGMMQKTDDEGSGVQKEVPTSSEESMDGEPIRMMADASSRYVPFSGGVLTANSGKRIVLFFYANWCPTCKPADADFTKNSAMIPDDVELIRVNYNDPDTDSAEKELTKKYGVTYQHTFVQIDATGKVVTKWNGGQTKELLANLK